MPNPRFKLFHDAALRSSRVKWLLHELVGDNFALEYVNIYGGEQYSTDYLAINPNHAVPTLEITLDDTEPMYMVESSAMIALLADAYPEKGLAPPPGKISMERVNYLQVLHFGATMDWMLWQIRIHEHILAESEKDHRTILRYKEKFSNEVEPQLLKRLQKTTYICGDRFCAADCIVAHVISWAKIHGLCNDPAFNRYLAVISERPSYAAAFADLHRFIIEVPPDAAVHGMFTG